MMGVLVEATAVGMGVYVWLRGEAAWILATGFVVGMVMQDDWMMLSGLWIGLGLAFYRDACQAETRRGEAEQAALVFMVRLRQMLGVKGSLAAALDELGYRSQWGGGDAGEQVLQAVANQFRVASLSFLAQVALMVRRHGGSLLPVAEWASDAIQNRHALRQARRLEEATQRSTILILAFAPAGVLAVFRLLVPSFYQALLTSRLGDGTILGVGITIFAVFAVLAYYIRREAQMP